MEGESKWKGGGGQVDRRFSLQKYFHSTAIDYFLDRRSVSFPANHKQILCWESGEKNKQNGVSHLAHVFSPGGHAGQNRGRRRSDVGAQGQRVHPFQAIAKE